MPGITVYPSANDDQTGAHLQAAAQASASGRPVIVMWGPIECHDTENALKMINDAIAAGTLPESLRGAEIRFIQPTREASRNDGYGLSSGGTPNFVVYVDGRQLNTGTSRPGPDGQTFPIPGTPRGSGLASLDDLQGIYYGALEQGVRDGKISRDRANGLLPANRQIESAEASEYQVAGLDEVQVPGVLNERGGAFLSA